MTPFHPGELAVQRRLGQDGIAAKVGRTIRADIPPVAAEFLAAQPMVV
ncbi:pyridoxamine 5'-phosphate oxidase family protein, partial [Nocardia elegans]|nr:pyridoxamine 5'-phosphate oxidase family protein [Nocardia elegans]